jgi:MFS family permease
MFNKRDASILIGNALDHFDTALYGFLVPILSPIFFPEQDRAVALMLGYGVLITSFCANPIGAFIFGNIAKHYCPNVSLSYSLIGLSVSTVIIGLLPTYESVGIFAPILLVIIRIAQSVFAGGEVAIARLYILENKSKDKAFAASYYYQFSSMVGIIFASAATTVVYLLPFNPINWRLCFLLGGLTGAIGYMLRRYEPTIYRPTSKLLQILRLPTVKSFLDHKKPLIAIAFTGIFSHMTYSIAFILMNSLIPLISDISIKTMMELNTILLILDILLIPIIGRISAEYNSKKILINSALIFAVTIVPLVYYLSNASLLYTIFARIWIIILGVIFVCPLNLWYKNLVIKDDQYLLVGIVNAVGGGIVGKATSAITLAIWYNTGSILWVGSYLALIAIVTAYFIWSVDK